MTTIEKPSTAVEPAHGEVVTVAGHRLVHLHAPGHPTGVTVSLITLDNGRDQQRPNTFGPQGLTSLDTAITTALAAKPAAIAITGKPGSFAAGADLGQLVRVDPAPADEFAALGHRMFGRLRDAPVPTFALINASAMGGGLELALHCDYRVLASDTRALSLPEVSLGIVPGWGGTQLLPRIAGPKTAVAVIVENALNQNRPMRAEDALWLDVVDAVLDSADFHDTALAWIVDVLQDPSRQPPARHQSRRPATVEDWTDALDRGKRIADRRTHGAAPAAYRALELIELSRTTELADGLAAERHTFFDLMGTQQFRASVYSFDLVQRRSRTPAGVPDLAQSRDVRKVGVIGAGLMAGQLALLFARSLHVPVLLTDVDQARLDAGVTAVHANISAFAKNNRITPADAARLTALISGSLHYADFADADFIIEAVHESITVKQDVFAELEKFITPTAILASNTSSLSITEIAKPLQHPERVIGYHFFNPVDVMPLLEIVRADQTDDPSIATAFALAKRLRKAAILIKDQSGFVVNRLLLRSMGEVLAAIDEGTPIDIADNALAPLGLPMTTMQLVQLTGPAVVLHVQRTLNETFGDRFPVSENLRRIVDAGHRTVLTRDPSGAPTVEPKILALLTQGNQPSTSEQVRSRVRQALAQEARQMLDDRVVADARDIDLAMITGAGWPTWLGGITPYLDREGISEQVTGKRFAPAGVATLPVPGHAGPATRSVTSRPDDGPLRRAEDGPV
jgi:3-hydroxyacyl-CoA dehydrogenase/enoyl-CoA hydratase/carnithine racemase